MVSSCPPLSIVAVLVPLVGVAMVPVREPLVVGALVERLSRTLLPAPVLLGLLTARVPVVAPRLPPVPTVSVPPLTMTGPVWALTAPIVSVPSPDLVNDAAPLNGESFPAQWDPKLGIHVT